jgi:hypothetical protein
MAAKENPGPLAAARAPNSFCLAAEHSEDIQAEPKNQAQQAETDQSGFYGLAWWPADLRLANSNFSSLEGAVLCVLVCLSADGGGR